MVNISKKKLRKEVLTQIHVQFNTTILNLKNTRAGSEYLNQLLTESEQLMLAKRLAVILMLKKNISWSQIQNVLGVSRMTVAKLHRKINVGELHNIEKVFGRKKDRDAFWLKIEVLLRAGMPEQGRGRWKSLNAMKKQDSLHRN